MDKRQSRNEKKRIKSQQYTNIYTCIHTHTDPSSCSINTFTICEISPQSNHLFDIIIVVVIIVCARHNFIWNVLVTLSVERMMSHWLHVVRPSVHFCLNGFRFPCECAINQIELILNWVVDSRLERRSERKTTKEKFTVITPIWKMIEF